MTVFIWGKNIMKQKHRELKVKYLLQLTLLLVFVCVCCFMALQASVACVRIQALQASYQRPPLSPSPLQSHNALLHLNVSEQDYCELDRNILQLCGTLAALTHIHTHQSTKTYCSFFTIQLTETQQSCSHRLSALLALDPVA